MAGNLKLLQRQTSRLLLGNVHELTWFMFVELRSFIFSHMNRVTDEQHLDLATLPIDDEWRRYRTS